jgi:hypothetical protein
MRPTEEVFEHLMERATFALEGVQEELAGLRADLRAERTGGAKPARPATIQPDARDRSADAGYDASGSGGAAVVPPEEG